MAMRAPSLDLLRVLRTSAFPRACCISMLATSPSGAAPARNIFTTTTSLQAQRKTPLGPPKTHDRGPKSTEDTQTDFGALDVLRNTTTPATSIDACTSMGFHLNNGLRTTDGSGILLLGGEAFTWRPWAGSSSSSSSSSSTLPSASSESGSGISSLLSRSGILELSPESFGVLELLYPKPDLLILGTGARLWMLSPQTRTYLEGLGVRVEMQDTANASSTYNLLATERGVDGVGAAMLPLGFKGLVKK